MPVKVIAASLGLIGFAVAIAAGVAAGNSAMTTMGRALGAMAIGWLFGWVVGSVGRRAVLEHVDNYKQTHPIPQMRDVLDEDEATPERVADDEPQDATNASTPAEDVAVTPGVGA